MQTLNFDHICIQTFEICNSGTRRLGCEEQPDAEEDHGEVRGEDRGVNGTRSRTWRRCRRWSSLAVGESVWNIE